MACVSAKLGFGCGQSLRESGSAHEQCDDDSKRAGSQIPRGVAMGDPRDFRRNLKSIADPLRIALDPRKHEKTHRRYAHDATTALAVIGRLTDGRLDGAQGRQAGATQGTARRAMRPGARSWQAEENSSWFSPIPSGGLGPRS